MVIGRMILAIRNSVRETKMFSTCEKWGWRTRNTFLIVSIMAKLPCSKVMQTYFQKKKYNLLYIRFLTDFLQEKEGVSFFDFNGAKLPDIYHLNFDFETFRRYIFGDTFAVPIYWNDDYNAAGMKKLDKVMSEGPYGYDDKDLNIKITVESGDIVIDAGAWVGDFSAYSSSKNATCYAFEPANDTYSLLCQTSRLNSPGRIIPVKMGLGDMEDSLRLGIDAEGSGNNSFHSELVSKHAKFETVRITTIDNFVRDQQLEKVDFIKSDIEGMERNLLMGACVTLKRFAPKLAICTYHLPDDPEVLERIIKEANPAYRVVHLRKKLFAAIPG